MLLRKLRQRSEALALRGILSLLEHVPRSLALLAGRAMGAAAFRLLSRRRRTALANLEMVWAAGTDRETIARASFHSLGRLVVEFARMSRLSRDRLDRIEWEGWDEYQQARARGRGVLYLAAHFGPWELLPYAQAVRGAPMAFVVRPADNPWLESLVRERRERAGNAVIAKRRAVSECLRRLRRGETVGVLIDQHVPPEWGVPTRLFGQDVFTTPMLAALALRTGAPVLPAFAIPENDGSVRIRLGPEVPLCRSGDRAKDIAGTTQRFVDVVESYVRQHPELWLWSHRRFRAILRPIDGLRDDPEAPPDDGATGS